LYWEVLGLTMSWWVDPAQGGSESHRKFQIFEANAFVKILESETTREVYLYVHPRDAPQNVGDFGSCRLPSVDQSPTLG
jgi:hypothetical protein